MWSVSHNKDAVLYAVQYSRMKMKSKTWEMTIGICTVRQDAIMNETVVKEHMSLKHKAMKKVVMRKGYLCKGGCSCSEWNVERESASAKFRCDSAMFPSTIFRLPFTLSWLQFTKHVFP